MDIIIIEIKLLPCTPELEKVCAVFDKLYMKSKKTNVNLLFTWN